MSLQQRQRESAKKNICQTGRQRTGGDCYMTLGARGKVKGGVVSRLECVTMNILAYHFAIPDTHTHTHGGKTRAVLSLSVASDKTHCLWLGTVFRHGVWWPGKFVKNQFSNRRRLHKWQERIWEQIAKGYFLGEGVRAEVCRRLSVQVREIIAVYVVL